MLHLVSLTLILAPLSSSQIFKGTTMDGIFTCHCSGGQQCVSDRGSDSGHCSTGCARPWDDWAPWSGPGCQIGNVAYGKPAHQNTGGDEQHPASNAVDGSINRNPRFASRAGRPWTSQGPSWYVDLGADYVIQQVQVTTVQDLEEQIYDFMIYVSSSEQYSPADQCTYESGNRELVITDCHQKVGRFVRVQGITSNDALWLTEVYVKGYEFYNCSDQYEKNYWFGPACLSNCHCIEQCNSITGHCEEHCKPGYTGVNCQETCSLQRWGDGCINTCFCDSCDHVSGHCGDSPCYSGHYGVACDKPCSNGTWGKGDDHGCPGLCHCANTSEACAPTNGSCPNSVCARWYTGTGCDYEILRLGTSDAPVKVDSNGRNVTIRFTRWHPQYVGHANESDISYSIQYSLIDDNQYQELDDSYVDYISKQADVVLLTLPAVRTHYNIRVVPVESSDSYEGPGEPSPALVVFTECKDGWYGDDCQHTCGCAVSDVCDKVTGETPPAADQECRCAECPACSLCVASECGSSSSIFDGKSVGIACGSALLGAGIALLVVLLLRKICCKRKQTKSEYLHAPPRKNSGSNSSSVCYATIQESPQPPDTITKANN